MKIITVTSDNFLEHTRLLLESIRVWHAEVPVTVYALEHNWSADHAAALKALGAQVQVVREIEPAHRGRRIGAPLWPMWKLDVFLQQREPFLYLDSDTLILAPLDHAFHKVEQAGWLSVREPIPLRDYNWGQLRGMTLVGEVDRQLDSFNAGVLGCDPARRREVLGLAYEWAGKLDGPFHTDQALLNLAWYQLHRELPEDAGATFNSRLSSLARVDISATVVHLAGIQWRKAAASKLDYQRQLWSSWPRGVRLTPLAETPFWQQSLPHPWRWPNQRNQPRHRRFVRVMRRQSLDLIGTPWLVVRNEYEAYLLDRRVLADADAFWRSNAGSFSAVRHLATYHLNNGRPVDLRTSRRKRVIDDLRSLLPERR